MFARGFSYFSISVLCAGLLFAALPTGAQSWRWAPHVVALGALAAATVPAFANGGRVAHLENNARVAAVVVGTLSVLALAAALAAYQLGDYAPDWAPPGVRALAPAIAECVGVLLAAAAQSVIEIGL